MSTEPTPISAAPRKFTEARALSALEARRAGKTKFEAAIAADVSHVTLWQWLKFGDAGREPYVSFAKEWRAVEAALDAAKFAAKYAAALAERDRCA